jgi:plasmid stabilization system protein ParE
MIADQGFELHPGAASDITSIWEFIAKDNPLAAKRVREDILDAIRRLVPFPHQGRWMREIRPSRSVEGVVSNHDPYSDSYHSFRFASWLAEV